MLEPLAFWKARSSWLLLFAALSSAFGLEIDAAYADLAAQGVSVILAGLALRERANPKRAIRLTDAEVQGALLTAATSLPVREKLGALARGLLK
ncbi:hypothetical protein [Mangrovicoccus ximenensis]|uniref:hypothetical protein n=1 Tax=Mangrovicoccus ximenensis TaxID=1911570 RepID=UPI000D3B5C36|nr:hypothetical protein [Mangrovicoccus ximenensis]